VGRVAARDVVLDVYARTRPGRVGLKSAFDDTRRIPWSPGALRCDRGKDIYSAGRKTTAWYHPQAPHPHLSPERQHRRRRCGRARDRRRAVDARGDRRVHELVQRPAEADAAQAVARHAPLAQSARGPSAGTHTDGGARTRSAASRRSRLRTRPSGPVRGPGLRRVRRARASSACAASAVERGAGVSMARRTCSSRTIHSERRMSALGSGAVVYRPRYVH
jgi:hypothetical protein